MSAHARTHTCTHAHKLHARSNHTGTHRTTIHTRVPDLPIEHELQADLQRAHDDVGRPLLHRGGRNRELDCVDQVVDEPRRLPSLANVEDALVLRGCLVWRGLRLRLCLRLGLALRGAL
eukprot:6218952-Alexandrium_andersonii.AAC.1